MWKHLIDIGNKLLSLMRRTQKLEEDSVELHQELKDGRLRRLLIDLA